MRAFTYDRARSLATALSVSALTRGLATACYTTSGDTTRAVLQPHLIPCFQEGARRFGWDKGLRSLGRFVRAAGSWEWVSPPPRAAIRFCHPGRTYDWALTVSPSCVWR